MNAEEMLKIIDQQVTDRNRLALSERERDLANGELMLAYNTINNLQRLHAERVRDLVADKRHLEAQIRADQAEINELNDLLQKTNTAGGKVPRA